MRHFHWWMIGYKSRRSNARQEMAQPLDTIYCTVIGYLQDIRTRDIFSLI